MKNEPGLSHEDICRLGRVFIEHSNWGRDTQDSRIHEWLKAETARKLSKPASVCDFCKDGDRPTVDGFHKGIVADYRCAAQPVEETKYLKLLHWFKLFYNFYKEDVKDKSSACASALSEDGELQEFIHEADRIG